MDLVYIYVGCRGGSVLVVPSLVGWFVTPWKACGRFMVIRMCTVSDR